MLRLTKPFFTVVPVLTLLIYLFLLIVLPSNLYLHKITVQLDSVNHELFELQESFPLTKDPDRSFDILFINRLYSEYLKEKNNQTSIKILERKIINSNYSLLITKIDVEKSSIETEKIVLETISDDLFENIKQDYKRKVASKLPVVSVTRLHPNIFNRNFSLDIYDRINQLNEEIYIEYMSVFSQQDQIFFSNESINTISVVEESREIFQKIGTAMVALSILLLLGVKLFVFWAFLQRYDQRSS